MKLKEHRCPWCGVITDRPGAGHFRIQTCSNCKKRYTYYYDGSMNKIANISSILSCIIIIPLAAFNIYISNILFCIAMSFSFLFLELSSYERIDDDKKFTYKKYKASFEFFDSGKKHSYIRHRYFLQDKSIIPVCFVNDENIALSNVICICIEDTKRKTDFEFECVFSFLPLSDVSYSIKDENVRFFFYKDYKKIGEGIVFNQIESF